MVAVRNTDVRSGDDVMLCQMSAFLSFLHIMFSDAMGNACQCSCIMPGNLGFSSAVQ